MSKKKIHVIVVGQTPPPYHGQAIAIKKMIAIPYDNIEWHLVRMVFSKDSTGYGKFSVRKVTHLFQIVKQVINLKRKYKQAILYYPPSSGPQLFPILRDAFILRCVRPFFKKTVFHFHAAGISTYAPTAATWLQKIISKALHKPSAAIQISALNPPDAAWVQAQKTYILPHGFADEAQAFKNEPKVINSLPIISFMAVLKHSKGLTHLLEAVAILHQKGHKFTCQVIGGFNDANYEKQIKKFVKENNVEQIVEFTGVLTGRQKWQTIRQSDFFCFPTFYESESFGNVLVEAMTFELPVVATDWRAVPGIVIHERTGLIVPPQDSQALADALGLLIIDPERENDWAKPDDNDSYRNIIYKTLPMACSRSLRK